MSAVKVLFVFPNTSNEGIIALAVGTLAAIAKEQGCEVGYFETSFYAKTSTATEDRESTGEFRPIDRKKERLLPYSRMAVDLSAKLEIMRPDIMAVTANSLEFELFRELMETVRLPNPRPLIIVGGVHATIDPEEVIAHLLVDVLCIGEGEVAWRELLQRKKADTSIEDICNLWIKVPDGLRRNSIRPLMTSEELWATPVDYGFFGESHLMKPYDGQMYRRGLIELSRGCPFSCHYCVNSAFKSIFQGKGKFFRVRPFESMQQGVKTLLSLGAEMLQLQDESFFSLQLELLEAFCEWYGREVRLPLLLQTRPESVTEEKLRLVARMGVPVQVSLGVESGSLRVLKEICNRHMTLDSIRRAFALLHKYKLRSNAYAMCGFPTETRAEVFEMIRLIREIRPTLSIMSVFYPFKGVPLRQYCVDHGYIEGNEKARTFTDESILQNQPMSVDEIKGLRRTYRLYTKLPESFFPEIERCERDLAANRELFQHLVEQSWSPEYN